MGFAPGVWLVGQFGLDLSDGRSVIVLSEVRDDGSLFRRRVEFVAFSSSTGEETETRRSLAEVAPGDLVAVRVRVSAHDGGTSRAGRVYGAFATYSAVGPVVRLGAGGGA